MVAIFSSALVVLAATSAFALNVPRSPRIPDEPESAPLDCNNPTPNTCYFYPSCLEPKFLCGSGGYPIDYGLKYCQKFTDARPDMSSEGQQWVTDTMVCLQKALVPDAKGETDRTCSALRTFAFDTHPDCYVNSGICTLPPTDWVKIVSTVDIKQLFDSAESLKATLDAVDGCVEFYVWLVKEGLIKVVDEVAEFAEDVWDTITDGDWLPWN